MIFLSKMIRDPRRKHDNLMGLTRGLTFHSTKKWKCSETNFYINQFYEMRYPEPVSADELEWKIQEKLWHDRNCNARTRHASHRGYMYWTGPKNRWTFRYAGPLRDDQRWLKPFSRRPHGQYTRWRDDGPQNPPPKKIDWPVSEALQAHRDNFREAMKSYQMQCHEYERIRSADGRGKYKP